jgi:hypothetical protein
LSKDEQPKGLQPDIHNRQNGKLTLEIDKRQDEQGDVQGKGNVFDF